MMYWRIEIASLSQSHSELSSHVLLPSILCAPSVGSTGGMIEESNTTSQDRYRGDVRVSISEIAVCLIQPSRFRRPKYSGSAFALCDVKEGEDQGSFK